MDEYPPRSKLLIAALGFSFFWACLFIIIFNPFEPLVSASGQVVYPLMRIAALLGLCLASYAINVKTDFFSTEKGHRTQSVVALIFPVIMLSVFLAGLFGASGFNGITGSIAWFLVGTGLACLRLVWVELICSFGQKSVYWILCVSAIIGAAFFAVSSLVDPLAMGFLFAIMPYLSLGLLHLLEHEVTPLAFLPKKESTARMPLLRTTDAFITLYGVVFGLALSFLMAIPPSASLAVGTGIAIAAGAAAMLPFLKRNEGKLAHGNAQRVLFPFLVLGLIPLPFVEGVPYFLCTLLIIACFIAFSIANLDGQMEAAARYQSSPLYLVGRGGAPILVGLMAGYSIGLYFASNQTADPVLLYYAPLALVVLLTVFVTFVPIERDRFSEDEEPEPQQTDRTGHWKRRCETAARHYGLSVREKEVFALLAKGRGAEYIQNKLYISAHTVKTHTYNIYKKMGTSSREELMTIVEETVVPEEGGAASDEAPTAPSRT